MLSKTTMPIALFGSKSRSVTTLILLAMLTLCGLPAIAGAGPWPSFTATTLSGEKVDSNKLLGQPTLLILTPSSNAAKSTREWVNALRSRIDQNKYRIRVVQAIDLPFFMSEEDAMGRAKRKVPKRYHDQTWILNYQVMEEALGVQTDSDEAVIVVLDQNGDLVSQVYGMVTTARMRENTNALQSLSTD